MAAGRPAPEDSHMMMAAVAESATTQSTTSSTIRVVETEEQFNTECQKVLASRSDRHGTIADMDTCRAIDLKTDPEDCDGWTQQVVVWNKKCCGAKSGHLGHLFESQKVSERQIKELANIEKLEVAEITLQETRARTREIVYARWLDDVARGKPEDPTATRSCKYYTSKDVFSRCKSVHKMATGKSDDELIQSDNRMRIGTRSGKCIIVD